MYKRYKECYKDELRCDKLREFSNKYSKDTYEIEDGIFNDFPSRYQIKLLERFIEEEIVYENYSEDIVKMVYYLWPKYVKEGYTWREHSRRYPDVYFYNIFNTIREILRKFHKITVDNFGEERIERNKIGKSSYPYFTMLGFLPLLGDEGVELLGKIKYLHYDDAQDFLMFGLCHFSKEDIGSVYDVLYYWWKNGNINLDCDDTGAKSECKKVIMHNQKRGIDYRKDERIKEIMEDF